ncbi:SyrB-like regulator [Rhizobium sp. BK602]|uniref:SyrB-like regulator n=1 Tax=Rhizobium sp. BK602 TaxID=2586986 RepID=UPI00160C0E26|nr:SyrB-like regulator [Rhizobium sp. BK602]MBB3610562.1 hypothetical protein [Rhizobium sp. BK602]
MADENSASPIAEVAATDAAVKAPAPKKQRAPRRRKAATEETVIASPAKTEKLPRGRRKSVAQAAEAKLAPETAAVASKRTRKNVGPKKTPKQTAKAPASAADEMADLIQLEQENKKLRKTLADKLRAENADLRKRLGLD